MGVHEVAYNQKFPKMDIEHNALALKYKDQGNQAYKA